MDVQWGCELVCSVLKLAGCLVDLLAVLSVQQWAHQKQKHH